MERENASSNRSTYTMFAIVTVACALGSLTQTVMNSMLLGIQDSFGTTENVSQWLTTIYMLAIGITVPIVTHLSRKLSIRTLTLLSLGFFLLGSLIDLVAPNFAILLIYRHGYNASLAEYDRHGSFSEGAKRHRDGYRGYRHGLCAQHRSAHRRRFGRHTRLAKLLHHSVGGARCNGGTLVHHIGSREGAGTRCSPRFRLILGVDHRIRRSSARLHQCSHARHHRCAGTCRTCHRRCLYRFVRATAKEARASAHQHEDLQNAGLRHQLHRAELSVRIVYGNHAHHPAVRPECMWAFSA